MGFGESEPQNFWYFWLQKYIRLHASVEFLLFCLKKNIFHYVFYEKHIFYQNGLYVLHKISTSKLYKSTKFKKIAIFYQITLAIFSFLLYNGKAVT